MQIVIPCTSTGTYSHPALMTKTGLDCSLRVGVCPPTPSVSRATRTLGRLSLLGAWLAGSRLRGNQRPRAAKRTAPHSIRYVNSIAAKRPYSMRRASTGLTDEARWAGR